MIHMSIMPSEFNLTIDECILTKRDASLRNTANPRTAIITSETCNKKQPVALFR